MPPSTARYGFETRLAAWADGFARQLAGARCGFLVAFRADGSLRRVYVLPPGQALDGERKQSLTQAYRRWFLFSKSIFNLFFPIGFQVEITQRRKYFFVRSVFKSTQHYNKCHGKTNLHIQTALFFQICFWILFWFHILFF